MNYPQTGRLGAGQINDTGRTVRREYDPRIPDISSDRTGGNLFWCSTTSSQMTFLKKKRSLKK